MTYKKWVYLEEDVKQFIKDLKERITKMGDDDYYDAYNSRDFRELIDKLAGEDLIETDIGEIIRDFIKEMEKKDENK